MRETQYKDLTQTMERKKFVWLITLLIILTMICILLTTFIYAATQQAMGSHVKIHYAKTEDFTFEIYELDGMCGITGLKNLELTTIVIPAQYKGYEVAQIAPGAFVECTNIGAVDFEDGSKLVKIGEAAFAKCENLTKIRIPESVRVIDNDAFVECDKLAAIVIDSAEIYTQAVDAAPNVVGGLLMSPKLGQVLVRRDVANQNNDFIPNYFPSSKPSGDYIVFYR